MRLIASTISSPSYKAAKELDQILTPLTENTTQAVKNSADRIHKMQAHPEDQQISSDVSNLFTQVLVDEALRMVEEKLSVDGLLKDRTSIPTAHLVKLTELRLLTYLSSMNSQKVHPRDISLSLSLSLVIANLAAPLHPCLWL